MLTGNNPHDFVVNIVVNIIVWEWNGGLYYLKEVLV
jgi:hypothetical protein